MRDWRLWGVLAIALAARAGLLFPVMQQNLRSSDLGRWLPPDSQAYLALTNQFQSPPTLGEIWRWPQKSRVHSCEIPHMQSVAAVAASFYSPEIFRTPGYPVFLASARGLSSTWGGVLNIVVAIQVFVDLHLVLLTFLLGRWVLSHRAGLLAALFQAISPLAVAAPCRVLSDSLFAFLLTAAVLLFVRHLRTSGWWSLLASAATLGMACYVRPIGLPMAGVFGLALLVERARLLRRAANAAAFAGVVALLIAPWVARNAAVADFYGFSSVQAEGMYLYTSAETLAVKEGKAVEEIRQRFREEAWRPEPGRHVRHMQSRAWQVAAANPGTFLWVHLKGCMAFWLPGATEVLEVAGATTGQRGTLEVLHREGIAAAGRHYFGGDGRAMLAAGAMSQVDAARYLGVLVLGVAWVRKRMKRGQDARDARDRSCTSEGTIPCIPCILLPVLIVFVGLVLISFLLPGPASHPRFRVPVEPLLSITAAAGWLGVFARRKKTSRDEGDERDRTEEKR